SELSVVFAHLNEPPPRVSELRPDLPVELDAVFETALAKSPNERYSTCGELAAAAGAALEGKTFVRRKERRRRLLIGAAVLAVVVGGTVGGLLATGGAGPESAEAARIALHPNALNLVSAKSKRLIGSVDLGSRASTPYADFDVADAGRSAWVLAAAK